MYSTVLCTCVRLCAPSTTVSGEGTTKLNYSCKLTLIWALVELQKLNSWQSWSGLFCKTTWSSTLTCYSVHLYRFVTHLPHRSPKAPKSEGSTELQLCDTAFIARGICIYNMSMRKNSRERRLVCVKEISGGTCTMKTETGWCRRGMDISVPWLNNSMEEYHKMHS